MSEKLAASNTTIKGNIPSEEYSSAVKKVKENDCELVNYLESYNCFTQMLYIKYEQLIFVFQYSNI